MGTLKLTSHSSRMQSGFTLVELIVVLAIGGIIMAIAAPAFNTLVLNNRLKAAVADLQSSLYFARSEAMKRGASVEVTPNSGNWKNGWVVKISAGAELRRGDGFSTTLTAAQSPTGTITYGRNGRLTAGAPDIVLSVSGSDVSARCLVLDLSGRPKVMVDHDGDPSNGCG
jgi:type IV fimbrial biogenesis protein FimT